MDNTQPIIDAAVYLLRQMEAHRGNEHWTRSDEEAFQCLQKSLPPEVYPF